MKIAAFALVLSFAPLATANPEPPELHDLTTANEFVKCAVEHLDDPSAIPTVCAVGVTFACASFTHEKLHLASIVGSKGIGGAGPEWTMNGTGLKVTNPTPAPGYLKFSGLGPAGNC